MARRGVIIPMILFALTCNIFVVTGDNSGNWSEPAVQDIPKRCIEHSVSGLSCKNVNSDDSLMPHPNDCELFYYCVSPDHQPICRQCPAKLHFNPTKHVCDLPERAGCELELSGDHWDGSTGGSK